MVDNAGRVVIEGARARAVTAVVELERAGDLAAALEAVAHLEHIAAEVRERLAVAAVLGEGWSYARLGRALGITRQGAHKQYAPAVAAEMRRRRRQITAAAVTAGGIQLDDERTS